MTLASISHYRGGGGDEHHGPGLDGSLLLTVPGVLIRALPPRTVAASLHLVFTA